MLWCHLDGDPSQVLFLLLFARRNFKMPNDALNLYLSFIASAVIEHATKQLLESLSTLRWMKSARPKLLVNVLRRSANLRSSIIAKNIMDLPKIFSRVVPESRRWKYISLHDRPSEQIGDVLYQVVCFCSWTSVGDSLLKAVGNAELPDLENVGKLLKHLHGNN